MNITQSLITQPLLLAAALATPLAIASDKGKFFDVETFPKSISADCRNGVAKIYDECGSQIDIIQSAVARAAETGKTPLVVYGAEWCIWCHVFDKYTKGEFRKFYYEWEYDGEVQKWLMRERDNKKAREMAEVLNKYVSENFVMAHVDNQYAPDGIAAINSTGYNEDDVKFLPFIAALTREGKYADHMLAYEAIPKLEIRKDSEGREFRGFDRQILLGELMKLRDAAAD